MLPVAHQIAFALFMLVTLIIGLFGFYRLYLRVRRGRPDPDARTDRPLARALYAVRATLTQERTFRKRPWVSFFHALIVYGFLFYLLVNVVDLVEGFVYFQIPSTNPLFAGYNLLADLLSVGVLVGVVALFIRRFFTPSKRDFVFNEKTLLHPLLLNRNYIIRDSLIVSGFIFFHVASRMVAQAGKLANYGADPYQPFATALSGFVNAANWESWFVFGFWGALGSILAFLAYFPYSKHLHIMSTPLNYALARREHSGVLPAMKVDLDAEEPELGAETLEDLSWARQLDAYACIQCNRCQDVCPASATGKALSPAALEINKRMELNMLGAHPSPFTLKTSGYERGAEGGRPLLEFAISEEAVWACTTCGACMQVCPVQDEQMLDIVDIRRNLVMVQGEFPPQLQTAFRGMERAKNPWGIAHDKRMEWAEGLKVPTIEENPEPDVLYWVGCAAAYDPGAQKVARAFVQLLDKAGVNYAVLGKKEACTGDSARRAGNEFLYQQLAEENVATLNEVRPKLVVATCPHCMNIIGHEYRQIGGEYVVMHHTEYLETLVRSQALQADSIGASITYHDPCYLGRHNGVYDAPREVLRGMGEQVLELERSREKGFCCGAGGAQFWKEEEEGSERVSDNRFKEIQARLDAGKEGRVVAVGCPFCKSMLNSTPAKGDSDIVVKDVAEILLEGVQRRSGEWVEPTGPVPGASPLAQPEPVTAPIAMQPVARQSERSSAIEAQGAQAAARGVRIGTTEAEVEHAQPEPTPSGPPQAERPKWGAAPAEGAQPTERPKWGSAPAQPAETQPAQAPAPAPAPAQPTGSERPKWGAAPSTPTTPAAPPAPQPATPAEGSRPKWGSGAPAGAAAPEHTPAPSGERPKWGSAPAAEPAAPQPTAPQPTAPSVEGARPKWGAGPSPAQPRTPEDQTPQAQTSETQQGEVAPAAPGQRPKWGSGAAATPAASESTPAPQASAEATAPPQSTAPAPRPKWGAGAPAAAPAQPAADAPADTPAPAAPQTEQAQTGQPQTDQAQTARPKWGGAAPATQVVKPADAAPVQDHTSPAQDDTPPVQEATSRPGGPGPAGETGPGERPRWQPKKPE